MPTKHWIQWQRLESWRGKPPKDGNSWVIEQKWHFVCKNVWSRVNKEKKGVGPAWFHLCLLNVIRQRGVCKVLFFVVLHAWGCVRQGWNEDPGNKSESQLMAVTICSYSSVWLTSSVAKIIQGRSRNDLHRTNVTTLSNTSPESKPKCLEPLYLTDRLFAMYTCALRARVCSHRGESTSANLLVDTRHCYCICLD